MANVIDFGMPIHEAVSAPRFGQGGPPETAELDRSGLASTKRKLTGSDFRTGAHAHRIQVVSEEGGMVNGITWDPQTDALPGGAHPRGRSYAIDSWPLQRDPSVAHFLQT
jgi:gamma-glutamyltranspeptidase